MTGPDRQIVCFRAALSTYIVFSIICGGLSLLATVCAIIRPLPDAWKFLAITFGSWAFALIWIASFKLCVTSHEVAYRTLFSGTKALPLSEIKKARVEIGEKKYSDRFKPFYRTILSPHHDSYPEITINLKVFTLPDVREFHEIIEQRCPGVKIS